MHWGVWNLKVRMKGSNDMKNAWKKTCVGACSVLAIPFLTVTMVNAAESASPAPTAVVSTESSGVETPSVETTFQTAFPDENFRKFVNETFFSGKLKDNENLTKEMQQKLAAYTDVLDVSGNKIVNMKGIEFFTGITKLDCSHNNIQILDLSALKQLKKLDVSYNNLAEITFAQNNALESVDCSNNNLVMLNLAGMTGIVDLDCSNNRIGILNISGLYNLKTLDCSDNALSVLNVDGFVALEELYCDGNAIVNLNVSTLKNLKVLESRKSVLNLKVQAVTVGTDSFCGVVLPTGAAKPENISNSGTFKDTANAIVWSKITDVPASFTYTYVVPGTAHTVTVSVNVDKSDFADKAVKLDKVATLTAASTAYNKIKLTWSGVDGATGYRIYRSTSKTSGFKKIKSITSNSKVTYTNSGIACGTTYYYKVRAYRLIDGIYYFGDYSNVISKKPVPAAPGGVKVAKVSSKKVSISWNKVTGASGYRIYRSTSKTGGFSKIKTLTSGSKVTYKKTVSRKVKYYYKVRAYTTVNGKKVWGAYSAVKAKTLS